MALRLSFIRFCICIDISFAFAFYYLDSVVIEVLHGSHVAWQEQ